MSEIKPRMVDGEAWVCNCGTAYSAPLSCHQEECFFRVFEERKLLRAALAAEQAEIEELRERSISHSAYYAERKRAEIAEAALAEAREKLEAVRVECDLWPDCSPLAPRVRALLATAPEGGECALRNWPGCGESSTGECDGCPDNPDGSGEGE